MKKLITVFCLVILLVVNAQAAHFIRKSSVSSSCMGGVYRLAWDGDWNEGGADLDAACEESEVKVNGTVNGSLQFGSAYGEGGSVGIRADDVGENIKWSDASDNHVDTTNGNMTFFFRIYINAAPDVKLTFFFAWDEDGGYANYAFCDLDTDRTLECQWRGNSTNADNKDNTDAVPTSTWTTVAFAVDNTNNDTSTKIGAGDWRDDTGDAVVDWSLDCEGIYLGTFDDDPGDTEYIQINKFAIVTDYKASEPNGW
jgi:hypothetical protein